jgi:hypothetical protein
MLSTFLNILILIFFIKINAKKWHIPSKLTGFPDGGGQSM